MGWRPVKPRSAPPNLKANAKALIALPPSGFGEKNMTTLNNGYLGSRTDEERSEMRYLV